MTRTLALDRSYAARIGVLPKGTYYIEYNDSTHLGPNQWTRLLKVEIVDPPGEDFSEEELLGHFYNLSLEKEPTAKDNDNRVLFDQVAQSLVRTGILRPVLSKESARELLSISKRDALILVPDTNTLANGSLHWLLQSLNSTNVWVFPIVISLTQIQQHNGWLNTWARKNQQGRLKDSLRSRTLVNASLGLLERCGERYQVLEVDPQLLRYVRPSGRASADPDEGDVLEDRLLIEAIHSVLGATRSRTEKRVLTADVLLARMLHAEAIPLLFLQAPILTGGQVIPSIRYEPLAQEFQGAPLSHLLWDLAHSFSAVRLCTSDQAELLKLEAYWAGKTALDWTAEALTLTVAEIELTKGHTAGQREEGIFSKASVPEASLLQILRVAGAVLGGASDLDGILSFFADEDRPSKFVSRMALEVLLRASLIDGDENSILPTAALEELDRQLSQGNLDQVSVHFQKFSPYRELLFLLNEARSVSAAQPSSSMRRRLFNPSKDAFERLVRFPVYLGQAWTDEGSIRNGSFRPDDEQLSTTFRAVFEQHSRDRLAPLGALLPLIARELSVSPWVLRSQIQTIAERGGLSEFSFEPAVGKKAMSRDQVVSGSLRTLNVEPVPLDRLLISGRPVFTVERRG